MSIQYENISSVCTQGQWICTNRTCPRTCSIIGQMQITTFDGKQYSVMSPCEHRLIEVSNDEFIVLNVYFH